MYQPSILPLLVLPACLAATVHQPHSKRGSETNATLYAYGTDSDAWPIAYGVNDGLLYITQNPDTTAYNATTFTPLTWDLPSITDECWIANSTFINGTRAGSLFIKPEDDYALGVLPITRAVNVNGTVSGFALFASQLVYNNNTYLEAQFWATTTDTEGIYRLAWNAVGELEDGNFPVVVKGVEN